MFTTFRVSHVLISPLKLVASLNKNYIQPRLILSANVLPALRLNASWGMYNQFIAHSEIIDEYNRLKLW